VLRPRLALLLLVGCDAAPVDPAEPTADVPAIPVCEPVADGTDIGPAESALLAEINLLRAQGGRCGPLNFLPAAPLRFVPALRCAARLHSADMVARQYLGQVDPDNLGTGPRLDAVGYAASTYGENVGFTVAGQTDADWDELAAADAVAIWADNPGTCWKLRARELEEIGIGAAFGEYVSKDKVIDPTTGVYWTAIFAAP
jgi:uncharacterized protein YkwD